MSIPNACLPLFRFLLFHSSQCFFFILVWFLCFYSFMVNPPGLLNFTIAESFGLSRAFGPGKWKTGGGAATAVGVSVVSQPTRVWVCVRVLESGECTQSRKGKVFVWTARNQHESNVDDNENKSAFVGVFWGGYGFWNNWIIAALRKLRKKCLLTHGESNATWFCDTSCTQMEYDMHASPKCGNLELYTHINIYIYLYICCMW